ncbi:MAG: toxin-antitoxin system YwqK family antitoxin [Verrucomicrobia bacterium]|nr:toxin-antitoxin system YwqK family antitoxin [Verrucomicrobiota bacterium]
MKQLIGGLFLVLTALTGCNRGRAPENLAQMYIHKYGVETDKADWDSRGKNGQVVTTRRNGVTLTQNFEGGALHGETLETFPHSSTVHTREIYDHGRLLSRQENHLSGLPAKRSDFRPGGERSVHTWYEDGTPCALELYRGELLVNGSYFNPDNVIEARVEEGNGLKIVRAATGAVISEETIHGGQTVISATFYPSGEPKSTTPFVNGQCHGVRKIYAPGGMPQALEEWKHGLQDGLTTLFEHGRKVAEISYVAGEKEGVERNFDSLGNVTREIAWEGGQQHGPMRYFVDNRQSAIEWYHQGKLVRKPTWERLNGLAAAE